VRVECSVIIGVIFYRLLYIVVHGERDFSPHFLFLVFDAPTLTLLLSFDLSKFWLREISY
jgi:hypothetical protein